MKHARPDYARIQDPAANPELFSALDYALSVLAVAGSLGRGAQPLDVLDALRKLSRVLHPTYEALLARITSGAGGRPIADDEPVFLIRATDMTGPDAVDAWARLQWDQLRGRTLEAGESDRIRAMARAAVDHAAAMRAWQKEHGSKVADMPAPQADGGAHA